MDADAQTGELAGGKLKLKRAVRSIRVVDATIPEFSISGAFLGELAHTESAQPSRCPYSRRSRARA
jgi:hypothetical protein